MSWEEEFDKLTDWMDSAHGPLSEDIKELKDFILSLLTKEKTQSNRELLERVESEVEGMRQKEFTPRYVNGAFFGNIQNHSYSAVNKTLEKILEALAQIKKEI